MVSCTLLGARMGRYPEPVGQRVRKKWSKFKSKMRGCISICTFQQVEQKGDNPTTVGVEFTENPLRDKEEAEPVSPKTPPSNEPKTFEELTKALFQEFDFDGGGTLDAEETEAMFPRLLRRKGLQSPNGAAGRDPQECNTVFP